MNGLQILPQWKLYFGNPEGALLGVMNAVYPLGKFVALLFLAYVSDRFGRKIPLGMGLVMCIGFAIMQGLAQSIPAFIAARALLGFATSFIAQPSPVLITELAYPTHRGKITAMYNTFFYFGAVFAAWSTFGTFKLPDTWAWRIPSLLQGAIPVLQITGLIFMPESPRWLVAKGRKEQARKILADYHAGGDMDAPLVLFELNEIEAALELEAELSKTSWMELVRTPANRKRTLIAAIVGWFAQWYVTVKLFVSPRLYSVVLIKPPSSQERCCRALVLPRPRPQHYRHHQRIRPDPHQRPAADLQLDHLDGLWRYDGRPRGPPHPLPRCHQRHACQLHYMDGAFGALCHERRRRCRKSRGCLHFHLLLLL